MRLRSRLSVLVQVGAMALAASALAGGVWQRNPNADNQKWNISPTS